MKPVQSDVYFAHQSIFLLLPWYVNHTLSAAELKQVEEHLSVCLVCKREVINLQKLAEAVKQPAACDSPEQIAFGQLKKRLQQASAMPESIIPITHHAHYQPVKKPRLNRWHSSRAALAMAAALLIAVLVPGYLKFNALLTQDFRTLSEQNLTNSDPREIHLVFAENTTPKQIQQILAPVAGQIVGKPVAESIYTVRFEQVLSKDAFLMQLAELKKNPQVVFAEPAYAQLSVVPDGGQPK